MPILDKHEPAKTSDNVDKGADTATAKLSREVALFSSMPKEAAAAIADKVTNHKADIAKEAAVGVVAGLAIAAVAKNPGILGEGAAKGLRVAAEYVKPFAIGAMSADWGIRLGAPAVDTWLNKNSLEENKKQLGINVGEGAVSYAAGFAGGALGAHIGFKGVPGWKNVAPEFDAKPSLKLGEAPRKVKDADSYMTARETELKPDVIKLYENSFPPAELQPVDEVRDLVKEGKILVHATRDKEGELQAFSFVGKHDETDFKFANLDYIATQEVARSNGIGSLHAERLAKAVKAENPEFRAMTLEMESPKEPGIDADELATRLRRAKFYDRLDAPNTNIDYFITDFQDPSYRGLAHWRAWTFKPEEFNAVKAAHLMMTDEAGMQLTRAAAPVREFERNNRFFEPFNGALGSTAQASVITSLVGRLTGSRNK